MMQLIECQICQGDGSTGHGLEPWTHEARAVLCAKKNVLHLYFKWRNCQISRYPKTHGLDNWLTLCDRVSLKV